MPFKVKKNSAASTPPTGSVTNQETTMATNDTCCTSVPYWKINEGKLDGFKAGCEKFGERTTSAANSATTA